MKAQKMKKKKADISNDYAQYFESVYKSKVPTDFATELNTKHFFCSSIPEVSLSLSHVAEKSQDKKLIIFSINQDDIASGIKFLNEKTTEKVKEKFGPIFKEITTNLLRARDYLGLQLDLEYGNVSEKEFEELESLYLIEQKNIPCDGLKKYIEFVMDVTGKVFNSEEISTMFNCSAEAAEKAIDKMLLEERDS